MKTAEISFMSSEKSENTDEFTVYISCKYETYHNASFRLYFMQWNEANYSDRPETYESSMNIAGRLPENSRNSFVDLQSRKNSKRNRPKKFAFSLKADMLYFD